MGILEKTVNLGLIKFIEIPKMTKLKVKRTSELNNRARSFDIYIDGKKVGEIANGETKEFDIETGKHKLTAKVDWCQSKELDFKIQDDQTKTIEISGFKYGNVIIPLILGIVGLFFFIKFVVGIDLIILLGLVALIFLYPLYYISIGKNEYLIAKEVS